MTHSVLSPEFLFASWRFLSPLPFGKWLFGVIFGFAVPYSGTLAARIVELETGRAVITLQDRWRLRNHLGSIHAMALANFCEMGSGLALLSKLSANQRGILTGFSIAYAKKARGLLKIECDVSQVALPGRGPEQGPEEGDVTIPVCAKDANGDVVVRAEARWRVGLKRKERIQNEK